MPKLKDVSNYREWSTVIQSILWSLLLWDIGRSVEVMSLGFDKAGCKISKLCDKEKWDSSSTIEDTILNPDQSWLKREAEVSLFILCTIEFTLLDNINPSSTSKQLRDHLYSQDREKDFTLRPNSFMHLMTSKLNKYPSVKEYQLNFKSSSQKLYDCVAPLPKDLQLTAFFHGVEEGYTQWAFAKRSTIQNKAKHKDLLTIKDCTIDFLGQSRVKVTAEAQAQTASTVNNSCRNSGTRCAFYKEKRYEKDNCWKNHPEKRSTRFKHQDSTNHPSINPNSTDD